MFIAAYWLWEHLVPVAWNPFRPFLFLSYRLPESEVVLKEASFRLYGPAPTYSQGNVVLDTMRSFFQGVHHTLFPHEPRFLRFGKGWLDLCFIAYFIVVFSFLRQVLTMHVFKPLAKRWGIRAEQKQTRFAEQGYALTYWGIAGIFGLYVMSFQDSWWYNLDHLWYQYPHWVMRPELKLYYLLQGSYWMQQAFVMLLGLERPRKDYYELIAHLSKMFNYLDMNLMAGIVYSIFMVVWSYFRIYLSALTLRSVYVDYHRIPAYARTFHPSQGHWLVWWMQCHVFAPLLLLLLLNLFWYVLMWRILFRALRGVYGDSREEEEEIEIAESEKEGKAE
ncbi:LAG1 [Malassezia furfur]|nr:LAG1 [Malassezia furfur]